MINRIDKMPHIVAVYKLPDGKEKQINSNRSKLIRYPNGNCEFYLPDGSVMYHIAKVGITVACTGPRFLHPCKVCAKIVKVKTLKALRGY